MWTLLLACVHAPVAPPVIMNAAALDPAAAGIAPPALLPAPAPPLPGALAVADESTLRALLTRPSGVVTVVNFWATWCHPCREELPLLSAVARAHPDVRFVLVSVDNPNATTEIHTLTAGSGLETWRLDSADPSAALARLVPGWPGVIPCTVLVGAPGGVRARFDGSVAGDTLDAALVHAGSPIAGATR